MIPTKDRRREGFRRRFESERTREEGPRGEIRRGPPEPPDPALSGIGRYSSSFFASAMMTFAMSAGTGSYPTNFREW